MRKRVLSLCMVLALCLSLFPLSAMAEKAEDRVEDLTQAEVVSGKEFAAVPDGREVAVSDDVVAGSTTDGSMTSMEAGNLAEEPGISPTYEDSSSSRPQSISIEDMIAGNASLLTTPEHIRSGDDESASLLSNETNASILLIQTNLPWKSDANTQVLNTLKDSGYLNSYDVVTMAEASDADFTRYNVVMFANDQTVESYRDYELIRVALEDYVHKGGVVLFGACDNGWAEGELTTSLPGGVTKSWNYSDYDYIEDYSCPVITSELTGSSALTDSMLYGTHCSHTDFDESSLPEGSDVILRAQNTKAPTLVRYPYGNGTIIASGLTWEHGYNHNREFAQHSYDDLILYALSISGEEILYNPDPIAFPYSENEPSQELAEKCALYSLLAYQASRQNSQGEWIQAEGDTSEAVKAALVNQLISDGFDDLYTYNVDDTDSPMKGTKSIVYNKNKEADISENTISATIGHRRIKAKDDAILDQIAVIFRGTYGAEWYGNFDVTGTSYDPNIDYHWSFQRAVDDTMGYLADYIQEFANKKRLDTSNLSILTTGHSRGAAVANMFAHELTNISTGRLGNETSVGEFQNYTIRSVYAYTFATPNTAAYDKIVRDSYELVDNNYRNLNDNIFNFCFTDDFVPNLPLEAWHWGKYGETYWATAASLYEVYYTTKIIPVAVGLSGVRLMPIRTVTGGNDFYYGTNDFFGKEPTYNTKYTEKIAKGAGKLTRQTNISGVQNYYEKQNIYSALRYATIKKSPYEYMRIGLGGVMQSGEAKSKGTEMILGGLNGQYSSLSANFIIGGTEIFNPALNFAHQAGSYYVAMRTKFGDFKFSELEETGYSATLYSLEDYDNYDAEATHNDEQIAALRAFLEQGSQIEENEQKISNAEILGWDADNPSTWTDVAWSGGVVSGLDLSSSMVAGTLDLSGFDALRELDVSYNSLTSLTLTGCTALESLNCSGNQLTELDLSGLGALVEVDCSFNQLTSLDISDSPSIESLNCNNNELKALIIGDAQKLSDVSCAYNYLNTSSGALADLINRINTGDNGLVQFLPQDVSDDADFAENDVNRLLAIANYGDNNQILKWDTENPASWDEVTWTASNNTYYLTSVDFRDKNLQGDAVFDGCVLLDSILIINNRFTNISVENCESLKTLWCDGNLFDIDTLDTIVASYPQGLNATLEPQYMPEGIQLSEADANALSSLIVEHGLDLREDALYNYHMLEWTRNNSGIYDLVGIDFSGTSVSGVLDLSGFSHLRRVQAAGTGVTRIVLPDSVTDIASNAFHDCSSLNEVVFPSAIHTIGDNAFAGCSSLQTITLPNTLESIGAHAFENCTRLYLVSFAGVAPSLGQDAFKGCRNPLTLSLSFQKGSLELPVNKTFVLSTANFPENDTVTWESSKPVVATVSNDGVVEGKAEGAALITASSNGGFSATCSVLVTDGGDIRTFKIEFDAGNGTGTMASDTIEDGVAYVLPVSTFTPPNGQHFKAWRIGGKEYAPGYSYVFGADTTVTALYESDDESFALTVTSGTGTGNYKAGDSVTIVANSPEAEMQFKIWRGANDLNFLNGTSATTPTATFTMPGRNLTLEATYEPTTGPCYVATAVYGSYDCPEVWTLRRFRDKVLAKTWYGRLFIHLYYAVSPTAVRLFGQTQWFQNFFRSRLDPWVADLQANGFESTPYNDRVW